MADAVNNMWLTICDIRNAVQGMLETCCAPSCADVDITMTVAYSNPNISLTLSDRDWETTCYLRHLP